ncbi:hypothetical protein [Sorangium sp. So ce233]|uniref:hypothetical protein n=1 Tax=Sorangium sp. So ce233 TaxID=3133290 RepID=UPI003F5DE406
MASLRRLRLRTLVQGALLMVTCASCCGVPPSPGPGPWMQPAAVGAAPGTAPAAQGGVERAAQGNVERAARAADAGEEGLSPAAQEGARSEDGSGSTPARVVVTVRVATVESAVRSTVSVHERGLIMRARVAIETHTAFGYVEARRLLETHARQYPRGRLAREREALLRQIR